MQFTTTVMGVFEIVGVFKLPEENNDDKFVS